MFQEVGIAIEVNMPNALKIYKVNYLSELVS